MQQGNTYVEALCIMGWSRGLPDSEDYIYI
jgi:hypothetical protein